MEKYKRQTAYFCTAQQITQGEFVQQEGWEPSFLASNNKMYARIRLVGIVVDYTPMETVIDDGTGRCPLRSFDNSIPQLSVGDSLMIIGRPRSYGGQLYVLVETAKKVSPSWIKYFLAQKDILQACVPAVPEIKKPLVVEETNLQPDISQEVKVSTPEKKNDKSSLIDIIRELDPGDGAAVDEVIEKFGLPDAEEKLQFLIAQGEIFELRAGKIKVLE